MFTLDQLKNKRKSEKQQQEADNFFRMQQEKQSQIKTGKEYASINDLFIKWVEKDDDDEDEVDLNTKAKRPKDPLIVYGVGLKNYFQVQRQVSWALFWCSLLAVA